MRHLPRISAGFLLLVPFLLLGNTIAQSGPIGSAVATKEVVASGRVFGPDGKPLAGATVVALSPENAGLLAVYTPAGGPVTTAADGTYTIRFPSLPPVLTAKVYIIARKEGLAPDADEFTARTRPDHRFNLRLQPPSTLSGTVFDEAGSPIAGATVRATAAGAWRSGQELPPGGEGLDWMAGTTDAQGRFVIRDVPPDALADVYAVAPGRALGTSQTTRFQWHYVAGQKDIRLVLPKAARIEARVVEAGTDRGVAGVKVSAGTRGAKLNPVVTSAADGTLALDGLTPGLWTLHLADAQQGKSQEWFGESVTATVEAGEKVSGVKLKVSRGGTIEISVRHEEDKTPAAGVSVILTAADRSWGRTCFTEADGIARAHVAPGDCRVSVNEFGYTVGNAAGADEAVAVEVGKTVRRDVVLRKIPGTVYTVVDEEGQPVAGALVEHLPGPLGAPGVEPPKTDAAGRIEVPAAPPAPGTASPTMGTTSSMMGMVSLPPVIVRHLERNLAAAVDLAAGQSSAKLVLAPAAKIMGNVTDAAGKPIPDAEVAIIRMLPPGRAMMYVNGAGYSDTLWVRYTSADGRFEVKTAPADEKYMVSIVAPGYGTLTQSRRGRQPDPAVYDAGTFVLYETNSTVSGTVVDEKSNPVAGAAVRCASEQTLRSVLTDKDGRFTLNGLSSEEVTLQARVTGDSRLAIATAASGSRDVQLVLKPMSGAVMRPVRVAEPALLTGRRLPALDELGVPAEAAKAAADKKVLICFWNMEQRPSRQAVTDLAKRAEELAGKGIAVFLVHAAAAEPAKVKEWLETSKITLSNSQVPAGKEEQTQKAWGVPRLPWLVLTDEKHAVKAEGFSVGELDAKLAPPGKPPDSKPVPIPNIGGDAP
jgi:protocatechuate 3,4-dioxygenase beta subunit